MSAPVRPDWLKVRYNPGAVEEISQLDVVSMTPIDALNKLFELNEKAKRI